MKAEERSSRCHEPREVKSNCAIGSVSEGSRASALYGRGDCHARCCQRPDMRSKNQEGSRG